MYKIIFDLLVDPLGLPLNFIYEYLIMTLIDLAAYKLAYEKTGFLFRDGWISRGEGKATHWFIRILFYLFMWAVMRASIWIYGFVLDNKIVSLFAVVCILAIILTVKIFTFIEEKKRLEN